jgi:hypothetical protein
MPAAPVPSSWQASSASQIWSSEVHIVNASEVKGTAYNISVAPGKSVGVVWIEE